MEQRVFVRPAVPVPYWVYGLSPAARLFHHRGTALVHTESDLFLFYSTAGSDTAEPPLQSEGGIFHPMDHRLLLGNRNLPGCGYLCFPHECQYAHRLFLYFGPVKIRNCPLPSHHFSHGIHSAEKIFAPAALHLSNICRSSSFGPVYVHV